MRGLHKKPWYELGVMSAVMMAVLAGVAMPQIITRMPAPRIDQSADLVSIQSVDMSDDELIDVAAGCQPSDATLGSTAGGGEMRTNPSKDPKVYDPFGQYTFYADGSRSVGQTVIGAKPDSKLPIVGSIFGYRPSSMTYLKAYESGLIPVPGLWLQYALGVPTTPGDPIMAPQTGYDIGGGKMGMVTYATSDKITIHVGRHEYLTGNGGSESGGYWIYLSGVNVHPQIVALYQAHAATRTQLPELVSGQVIACAAGSEVRVAVRDNGPFQDILGTEWWGSVPVKPIGPPATSVSPPPAYSNTPGTGGGQPPVPTVVSLPPAVSPIPIKIPTSPPLPPGEVFAGQEYEYSYTLRLRINASGGADPSQAVVNYVFGDVNPTLVRILSQSTDLLTYDQGTQSWIQKFTIRYSVIGDPNTTPRTWSMNASYGGKTYQTREITTNLSKIDVDFGQITIAATAPPPPVGGGGGQQNPPPVAGGQPPPPVITAPPVSGATDGTTGVSDATIQLSINSNGAETLHRSLIKSTGPIILAGDSNTDWFDFSDVGGQKIAKGSEGAAWLAGAVSQQLSGGQFMLVLIGVNEVHNGDTRPEAGALSQYEKNLSAIVQLSLDRGVLPVLQKVADFSKTQLEGKLTDVNSAIDKVGGDKKVPVINVPYLNASFFDEVRKDEPDIHFNKGKGLAIRKQIIKGVQIWIGQQLAKTAQRAAESPVPGVDLSQFRYLVKVKGQGTAGMERIEQCTPSSRYMVHTSARAPYTVTPLTLLQRLGTDAAGITQYGLSLGADRDISPISLGCKDTKYLLVLKRLSRDELIKVIDVTK